MTPGPVDPHSHVTLLGLGHRGGLDGIPQRSFREDVRAQLHLDTAPPGRSPRD